MSSVIRGIRQINRTTRVPSKLRVRGGGPCARPVLAPRPIQRRAVSASRLRRAALPAGMHCRCRGGCGLDVIIARVIAFDGVDAAMVDSNSTGLSWRAACISMRCFQGFLGMGIRFDGSDNPVSERTSCDRESVLFRVLLD